MGQLIILDGASGVGKTTLVSEMGRAGTTVIGPVVWPAFDDFAAEPGKWAFVNQSQATYATWEILQEAISRQKSIESRSLMITDASLRRVELFNRVLLQLGLLKSSQYAVLRELKDSFAGSLAGLGNTSSVLLQCPEGTRTRRLRRRQRRAGIHSAAYVEAQTLADRSLQGLPGAIDLEGEHWDFILDTSGSIGSLLRTLKASSLYVEECG